MGTQTLYANDENKKWKLGQNQNNYYKVSYIHKF